MAVPEGMKRRAVDLPLAVEDRLQEAARVDRVTPTMRIRAMAEVWANDEATRDRVDQAARQLRDEVKTRQRRHAADMRDRRWPTSTE